MKIGNLFSKEVKESLKKELGITVSDEHDYSVDELEDLYAAITDDFPYEYDEDANPLYNGKIFEELIDIFVKNKLLKFW